MKKFLILSVIACIVVAALGLTACQKKREIKQIEVIEMPIKSDYYIGDTLDLAGCKLNVVYADNTAAVVDVTEDMVSAMDTSGIGPKTLIVTYAEGGVNYTTTMVLHVIARPAQYLRVITPPDRTTYVVGDVPDLTGLQVEAYYTEDQRITLGLQDLSYAAAPLTVDTTAVRVGFGNLTLDVPIVVEPLQVVGLAAKVHGDALYRNQVVHASLFDVWFVYNDLHREATGLAILAEENAVITQDRFVAHLKATHEESEFSCELAVDVQPDVLQSIRLVEAPLLYHVGQAFLWQDVHVALQYAHHTMPDVVLGSEEYPLLAADVADGTPWADQGALRITITYDGAAMCTFAVGVDVTVPVRWSVLEGQDEVVRCAVGEVPVPQFLRLQAVLSDGMTVDVWNRFMAAPGVEVVLPQAAVAGQTQASLTYQGLVYTFAIAVE